jgi:hypothetical protein
MVFPHSHTPSHLLKLLGCASAYACALVTGTALLMGAMAGPAVGSSTGQTLTVSESTMQQATEQALVAQSSQAPLAAQMHQGVLVASGILSND